MPELFPPRKLQLKPANGANGPRLWVRRLVIWPEPGASPLRDISFRPGLNVIWSPDPVDHPARAGEPTSSETGHGAGKTLVCRLLRYCLGEPQFASDALRGKISSAFKDGRVGAEIVVDGTIWAVVRSIGVFGHDVVREGGTVEAAHAEVAPTGMASFVEMLSDRFITPDVVGLVGESSQRSWLLALAWLTRDQECHFAKFAEWRAGGVMSGSPARGLSVTSATHVVRALLGAVTPQEQRLEEKIAELSIEHGTTSRALERRRWLIEDGTRRLLKELDLEASQVPEGDLFTPYLRAAIKKRVMRVAIVDARGEVQSSASLETELEEAQEEFERVTTDIAQTEGAARTASEVAKLIKGETPGLLAEIDDATTPVCLLCEVPIDRVLAEGCKLSHRLTDVAALRDRHARNKRELDEKQAELAAAERSLEQLRRDLGAVSARRDKARQDLRRARQLENERTDTWYAVRRLTDDADTLESLRHEQVAAERNLARLDGLLKERKKEAAAEREQHVIVLANLGAHFDPLVRRLVGGAATGKIQHDGNGLQLVVDFGGERNTAAIDLMKVLAFDLATLCRTMEGATHLPALLMHDSPRSSDLGLSIYHELFHLVRELEGVGPSPLFQYIVTTTSRPPDDLIDDERIRLKLHGAPAAQRLLGRDL